MLRRLAVVATPGITDDAVGRRVIVVVVLADRAGRVLQLLVEGLPNKLIARRLEISEKTVKTHLTSIFRALDVTDRTQAALWASRNLEGT